jgi:hypothetical protein
MRSVKIGRRNIQFPSAWDELTPAQLADVFQWQAVTLAMPFIKDNQKAEAFRLFLLQHWCGMTLVQMELIEPDQLAALMPLTDFIFDRNPDGSLSMKLALTKNPLPVIKDSHGALYGPTAFDQLTFYEWIKADHWFVQVAKGGQRALSMLIATLWRVGKPETKINKALAYNGDRRCPLRPYEALVPAKASQIDTLMQPWQQYMLLHWYAAGRAVLASRWPVLFSPEEAGGEEEKSKFGLAGLLLEVAGGKFGNLNETADTPLNTIMLHLAMETHKRKEAERQARLQRNR